MIAEFINPTDARWREALACARHDVYHLAEYAIFAARHEGGNPMAFYAKVHDTSLLIPLLLRPLPACLQAPEDWCDVASPYGYGGPIITNHADAAALRQCVDAFSTAASKRGIVSAFIRLHPLLHAPLDVLSEFGALVTHGEVVSIDLSVTNDELWRQTRGNHRTGIRKLQRAGFTVVMNEWDLLPQFIDVYHATMQRVSATDFYFFTSAYFQDLRAALGHRLNLCVVLSETGGVACAGLFTTTNSIVQYHLGGTADAYLRQAPSKLMFDYIRTWAKDRENSIVNLGGGVAGRRDSLFNFKAGFSKSTATYHTYRIIVDQPRYASLMESWKRLHAGLPEPVGDFFPPYRSNPT